MELKALETVKMCGKLSGFTVSSFVLPVVTSKSSPTEQSLAPKNNCATKLMSRPALLKTEISLKELCHALREMCPA